MPRTAFVLGGARNLGAMQVGMLDALLAAGVVPDLVLGCSVGAVNGAAVASSPSPAGVARLADVWRGLSWPDLWPGRRLPSAARLLRPGLAVHGNERLRAVLDTHLPASFGDLAVPFACVATSLATGRERWLEDGALVPAVLASAALPGLLPPVEIDGEELVDGAVVDVVPLARALELGAERVFVLQIKDVAAPAPSPRRPLDVILQAFAVSRNARFLRELAAVPDDVEVHVLPVVPWRRWRADGFRDVGALVAAARSASAAYLVRSGVASAP